MRSRILTPLAIAALALGAAACGDDDDKSGGGALSKKEFVKQADALCAEYKAKGKAIRQPANFREPDQAAAYLEKASGVVNEGVAKLKALEPPDSVKSDWDAYIARQEEGGQIVEGAADKAKAKDASGLKDLNKLEAIGAAAKASAKKAGATGCASG